MSIHSPDLSPERARVPQNIAWAIGGALFRYALAALTTLALTHLLAPQDFGLIAITAIVQLLIAHVLPVGFHDALIQRPRLDDDTLDAAFWSVLGVTSGAVLLSVLLAPSVAAAFGQPALAALLVGAAFAAWPRALSIVPRALLARRMDFRALTLARVVGQSVGNIAAVILAVVGAGAWSLLVQIALMYAVGGLIVYRVSGWRPRARLPRAPLRPLWAFAPSVALFTVLAYAITRADDLLIGYRLGAKALGYYALAYALMAWVVQDVLGGAAVVLYPFFARLQHDRAHFHKAYLSSVSRAVHFAYPTLVLLAVMMPVGVRVLLGVRWLPLVLPAQILALAGLREAGGMFNGGVYRALGIPHWHTLLGLVSAPCYVVAFLIGVDYGVAGVAFFFLLTGWLLQPLSWWLLWRAADITWGQWLRAVWPAAVDALWMGGMAALLLRCTIGAADVLRLLLVWGSVGGVAAWKARGELGNVRQLLWFSEDGIACG